MFEWFKRKQIAAPPDASQRCEVSGCTARAIFHITWAPDRQFAKEEHLCDEHARITITAYKPTPREPKTPVMATNGKTAFEIEYVVVTDGYPEQCIYLRECHGERLVPILTGYFEATAKHQAQRPAVTKALDARRNGDSDAGAGRQG
jgi:hypothetical protein